MSLRKPLGSLESPAASGAGLSPFVDILSWWDESFWMLKWQGDVDWVVMMDVRCNARTL